MSTTAGVFSETILRSLRVIADEIMFDDRIKQQFIPQIGIIDGLRNAQTALVKPKFSQIKDSQGKTKKYDVEVIWENACDLTAAECTVCTMDGTKLSTNAQTYSLEFCREVQFAIDEYDYVDNEFDAALAVAKGMLRADMLLSEAYAQYAVSVLEANKGINLFTGGKGCVSGSDTYIPAAYWDAKLMAYFMRVAMLNRFTTPTLISGSNLFEEYFVINKMQPDANGKGNAALMQQFPIYFDLFNIDSVNTPNLVTYLLSQNSVAIASRNYNPVAIDVYGASKRWSMQSRFIPELTYDVFSTVECSNDMVKTDFKVKLLADLFVNPEGCEADNSGILSFICGACPT